MSLAREQERIVWVPIATAQDQMQAINTELLLNRVGIPFRIKGEFLHQLYGLAGTQLFGPKEFLIPQHLESAALEALDQVFEVGELPAHCPACDAATVRGRLDCVECGLTLA